MSTPRRNKINAFDFSPGRVIGGKYVIEAKLGGGWEGEVYQVVEKRTGIRRAAKLFYPHRNEKDRAVMFYARKLDRLKDCHIVIQYFHSESVRHRGEVLTCLISELVEGELLSSFIARQRGTKWHPGDGVGMGNDHTLFALIEGEVHYTTKRKNRVYVSVKPQLS